jgi:hypothetical protein
MTYDAKYTFPEGELYVSIIPAVTKHETWGYQAVSLPESRLAISSSLHENDAPGYVTIRGRAYRVASRRTRVHARREEWLREQGYSVWKYESPLRRWEFANDRDAEIGESTAARKRLCEMVEEAATRFEAEHPNWNRISERLELEGMLRSAECTVATARQNLTKAEVGVANLVARIADYTDAG